MKRSVLASILAASLFCVLGGSALAQQKPKAAAASEAKPKVKNYDFTGDNIEGDLIKPEGEFLDTRKFATHTSLIRVRKDFIKEIVKSAEDL